MGRGKRKRDERGGKGGEWREGRVGRETGEGERRREGRKGEREERGREEKERGEKGGEGGERESVFTLLRSESTERVLASCSLAPRLSRDVSGRVSRFFTSLLLALAVCLP